MTKNSKHQLVPDDFTKYRVSKANRCPVCDKPDWCLSDNEKWAICQRVESSEKWKGAGYLHRLNGTGERYGHGQEKVVANLPQAIDQEKAREEAGKKLWPNSEAAQEAFAKFNDVKADPEARALLESYGIRVEDLPDGLFSVMVEERGKWIVASGYDAQGRMVSLKGKSVKRSADGKRYCQFFFGKGGALLLKTTAQGASIVIVAGEEKALVANLAGYHVLCELTGEHVLSDEWVSHLIEHQRAVILANDADPKGHEANTKTAEALELGGFPAERIAIVQWPSDAPEGFDLNDAAKQGGLEGVRALLEAAQPYQSKLPRVLSAARFLAVERPPLKWHIEKYLP